MGSVMGAIAGDVIGSRFEFANHRDKDFVLFNSSCTFTDDTILTVAIMAALIQIKNKDIKNLEAHFAKHLRAMGKLCPASYGGGFQRWLHVDYPIPYNSYGNGAGMRISPVAYAARSENELEQLVRAATVPTHNHEEGIKGAQTIAHCVWMAKNGANKWAIESYAANEYSIDLDLDELRKTNEFDETCQVTVPQAIRCFLDSDSYEDAIRNAISIGGDSDTIAAMTGSIASAYYGMPTEIEAETKKRLPPLFLQIIERFENIYCN